MRQLKRMELNLRCLSLFSGCGGLDLGLAEAGFDIVGAMDLDPNCEKSHNINFKNTKFVRCNASQLNSDNIFSLAGVSGPFQLELLAGGPPCPPFSKSRFYRTEKPRGLDDPNGRETISAYLRAVELLRPKAFVLENVKGLSYKIHKDALDEIVNTASSLNYETSVNVINAADYGVPQIRERCFVIGTLNMGFNFPSPTHSKISQAGLLPWVTAGEAISDLDTKDTWNDDGHKAGGKHNHLLAKIPPGDNYLFFTEERGCSDPLFKWRSRYWSFLLKLSPTLPSWTIQARRSNNMGPFHWRNRILRIPEIMRLQTFPDNWKLAGTIDEQWRQIGNAVPPLFAKVLGRCLHDHLSRQ